MVSDVEHIAEEGLDSPAEGSPLCPKCLSPIEPSAYYCPNCGGASNQLTPYIPFVNIRFNYSIFGRLWRKVWYEKASLPMKLFSLLLIFVHVPFMLIGLPFVLWDKLKAVNGPQDDSDLEEED